MRFVVVPLAVLLAFAATLRGQSWPSNAQVFRDVYGQVDAGGASVRWDAAKESQPSPYDGRSFAETGQEMAVEVLLRGEVNGRLYVATSAVPKAPVEYNCHACMAALGAVVYRRANGTWKLEASSPVAIYAGGWGGPPVGIELRRCGERTYCFVVEDWFTAQGYSESKLKVFGPIGARCGRCYRRRLRAKLPARRRRCQRVCDSSRFLRVDRPSLIWRLWVCGATAPVDIV
jgi:hypothetical protein